MIVVVALCLIVYSTLPETGTRGRRPADMLVE